MSKPDFVYVTFVASTPERVWNALLDGEMTKRYWNHIHISYWKPGSKWELQRCDDPRKIDIAGQVVEVSAPRRLVISWAYPDEVDLPEKVSRVTFEIESHEDNMVRLTVIHDELEEGSKMESGIRNGWPKVLSSLKTLLETGTELPMYLPINKERIHV